MIKKAKEQVRKLVLKLGSRHNKIFIIPTSYGLYFIAIVFVLFLISLSYGHSLAFTTTFIFVSLVMTSAHFTNYNLAGVEIIAIHVPDEVYAGEPAAFKVTLRNNTKKYRFDLVLKVSGYGESEPFSIAAGATHSQVLQLKSLERGEYQLKRLTLGSSFPFGLFYAWKFWYAPQSFVVFPGLSEEKLALPTPIANHQNRGKSGGNPEVGAEEFYGHQSYDVGMPLRVIDWKAYARGKGLYLKKFIEESDINYLITKKELNKPFELSEEESLQRLAALVVQAEATGAQYALVLDEESPRFGRGKGFKKENLRRLALHQKERQVLL